jgi:hypothetical protein
LELLPKSDRGILVMMELLSTLTVYPAIDGAVVLVNDAGAVKIFGCQSSRKKPMVLANGGSIAGSITTVVSTGGGGGLGLPPLDFLQATKKLIAIIITALRFNNSLFIIIKTPDFIY